MGEYWFGRGMKGALWDAGRFGYLYLVVVTWAFMDVNIHWSVHLRFRLFVRFILFTLYFNLKNLMWAPEWCCRQKAQLTVLTSSSVSMGKPLCWVQQLLQQTSSCLWLWHCLCTEDGLGYHSLGRRKNPLAGCCFLGSGHQFSWMSWLGRVSNKYSAQCQGKESELGLPGSIVEVFTVPLMLHRWGPCYVRYTLPLGQGCPTP